MKLLVERRTDEVVVLAFSATEIFIHLDPGPQPFGFKINWCVAGRTGSRHRKEGILYFDSLELLGAFSLLNYVGETDKGLIEGFGATSGVFPKFLRRDRYLHLPWPDLEGHDNTEASVYLTNEIIDAVNILQNSSQACSRA